MVNKISMLSTLPPIKGISPYTKSLLDELSKKLEIDFYGFKSIYPEFLYSYGTKTNEKEPKINNTKIRNYLTWYNPFSWIKTGLSIKTKILHVQWWSWVLAPIYLTVLSIVKLRGKKIIITVHNVKPHEKSLIKNFLNNSVVSLGNEYIVHSNVNKKLFLEMNGAKKPVHVIPHGIISYIKSKESRESLKDKYGYDQRNKIILFFGNIRGYKGLDDLITAFSKLKDNNVKLIIAGQSWEDFTKYDNLINNLNLMGRVKLFLGYQSESKIAELFRISDLIVYPYKDFESSSGAGSVAINYNKAIVVTNVGGLPELVKDKRVVAKPKNVEDLKNKIIYGLKNKRALEKDSREISNLFNWNKIADKTLEVYS